jgi:hypothetical protein
MKSLKYQATGVATLLMHSDVTANPLHPLTKELKALTSKRKKTDEDYERIAKAEFIASLYWKKDSGFFMPAKNIDATLLGSAKMFKLGVLWKQGAFVDTDAPFVFPHSKLSPPDLYEYKDMLYRDMQTVKIGTSKTVRCRPAFNEWSFDFTIIIDEAKLNERQVDEIVENAGRYVGICDYRPRYGKFNVTKLK